MESEKRLSDVDVLIRTIMDIHSAHYDITYEGIIRLLKDAPTVDAVEVVHGRWNRRDDPEFIMGDYECSACEYVECDVDTSCLEPGVNCLYYCPNCGAKMDGGNEDG